MEKSTSSKSLLLNQNLVNEDHENVSEQLLESQAHLWNHIFNFINSFSLYCATQLGIPDIIHSHGKPITLSQLISSLPIHDTKTSAVFRLMRILVHSGFFRLQKLSDQSEEEGYVLTDACKLLLKDNPMSAAPFLLNMIDPILTHPWHCLSTWFKNDNPTPFATFHGKTLWELGARDTKFNNFFNDAMASDARLVMKVVLDKHKGVFEGLKSLVDLAGGTGNVAKAIAEAFPETECTVFDQPHVVGDLHGTKNFKYAGGNMFEEIPPADAIFMKWIMHDWNDEDCVKLLKRCKEAIIGSCKGGNKKGGGKVIIVDMVIENQKEDKEATETQLFFDLLLMVLLPGRERTEKEWAKLFAEAGFAHYTITPLGLRSLIQVYP